MLKKLNLNYKLIAFSLAALMSTGISAAAFKGPGTGGPSGLIGTPTARTAWEGASGIGLDAGFHYVDTQGSAMVPKLNLTMFERWEIGGVFSAEDNENDDDWGIHTKFRFMPWNGRGNSALALGYFMHNWQEGQNVDGTVHQLYLAATFGGSFFKMPAETTMTFGKSFGDGPQDGDIDFSMGFELNLFPSVFKGYLHWLNDFSNYPAMWSTPLALNERRGMFNTGFRIAALKNHSRLKLDIDVLMMDALDDSRGFGMGFVFGLRI